MGVLDRKNYTVFDKDTGAIDIFMSNYDFIKNISGRKYMVSKTESLPDYMASLVYNDEEAFWIIMLKNELASHEQLADGLVVEVPSRNSIEKTVLENIDLIKQRE